MVLWIEKNQCTGCASCANICPVNAIEMQSDSNGFEYPVIDKNVCIHCKACEQTCLKRMSKENGNHTIPKTYAAWSREEDIRFHSTSGGAFSELAKVILQKDGVVIGAEYEKENLVRHIVIKHTNELKKIRQSKYIQSSMGYVFREIKNYLNSGKSVVFCGCPCQVSGLYTYLEKEYSNLVTIDFICRGVNSPKAYKAWLSEIEKNMGSKVVKVWFKYKKEGWKKSPRCTRIDFENGESLVFEQKDNLFMEGYLSYNLYMRPCCGECQFKGIPRRADITLADFWGLEKKLDDDKGASMILLNNRRGEELFEQAKPQMKVFERNFDEIFKGNTYFDKSVKISDKSLDFLRELDIKPFSKVLKKYTYIPIYKKIRKKLKNFFADKLIIFTLL